MPVILLSHPGSVAGPHVPWADHTWGTLCPETADLPALCRPWGCLPGRLDLRYKGGVELAHPLAPEAFELLEASLGFAHELRDVEA